MTGNYADIFLSDGKGNFRRLSPSKTGIRITGDIRNIVVNGREVIYGVNDSPARYYKLK
jgi:hypothetical protein